MIATVEISLYPLQNEYKTVIIDFILSLQNKSEIDVYVTEMSTYIKGEWSMIMAILSEELAVVYKKVPNSSTVIKIIPQDLPVEAGYKSLS